MVVIMNRININVNVSEGINTNCPLKSRTINNTQKLLQKRKKQNNTL